MSTKTCGHKILYSGKQQETELRLWTQSVKWLEVFIYPLILFSLASRWDSQEQPDAPNWRLKILSIKHSCGTEATHSNRKEVSLFQGETGRRQKQARGEEKEDWINLSGFRRVAALYTNPLTSDRRGKMRHEVNKWNIHIPYCAQRSDKKCKLVLCLYSMYRHLLLLQSCLESNSNIYTCLCTQCS